MRLTRAVFVSLSALESAATDDLHAARMCEVLRDYCATGYRVLVVTDKKVFQGEHFEKCSEIMDKLQMKAHQKGAIPFCDIVYLKNPFDPGPFWDAARRFNLSLGSSMVASLAGEHVAAARTAGVGRVEESLIAA